MKPVRLLLFAVAALFVGLLAAVVLAFNARVQTWFVRRALAGQPALHASIDTVSAGLSRVQVAGLRIESHGAVLTLPALEAELPLLSAGLREKVTVTRLTAKGWTLDLSKVQPTAGATGTAGKTAGVTLPAPRHDFSLLTSAHAAEAIPAGTAAATAQLFQGVFAQLKLPVDLTLDGVDLAGDIVVPAIAGHPASRVRVTLTGGGLAAGHEGKFALALDAEADASGGPVNSLALRANLSATMDTPRTFTEFGAKADASATGPRFPTGLRLTADLSAARAAAGENYTVVLATDRKQLLAAQAAYPGGPGRLTGTWKLDVRDADLEPFALGRALPTFEATGEGSFDADAAFAVVHAVGKLAVAADKLAALKAELGAMGAVHFAADFDLTRRGDALRVARVNVTLTGAQPIATVQSLQAFSFNPKTRELVADDATRELVHVTLHGVPLAWAQPFLKNLSVAGGDLRGEFAATARDSGFTLRSTAPLTASGVSLAQPGRPLLRAVDVSLNVGADYTPKAWQAEIVSLTAGSGGATLFTLATKAGQLIGPDQPIKATGKFFASLPAVLAQPAASGVARLTGGDATGEFVASLDAKKAVQAKLALTHLVADPQLTKEKLPALSADLRADLAADGAITLNVPILIERDSRKSDLTVTGTLTPGKDGWAVDARVASALLVVEDAKILGAPLASTPMPGASTPAVPVAAAAPAKPAARPTSPPWAGVSGQLALALKKVVYTDSFQASDVAGTLRLDAGAVKFENLHAGLGDGADAKLTGGVAFDAKSATPYALSADLAVNEFDPAPLFKALNPGKPATVEGKFTVASKLTGSAATLGDLATAAHGDFNLTSKGGVFRGLPVSVATKVETVGKLAAGAAYLGSLAGAVTGRKDAAEVTGNVELVAALAKFLAEIPYHQLSVVLTRDATFNTVLKDFSLISPEVRLTGGGQATHQAGTALLDEALAMEFKLRARGQPGDWLKRLNRLETQTDELGYAACTLPMKVGGTLGKPDTSELNLALASMALEKAGVTDKATDLIKGLFGGGK